MQDEPEEPEILTKCRDEMSGLGIASTSAISFIAARQEGLVQL